MAWEYVVPAVFALLGLCVVLYQHRKRKKAEEVAAGLQIFNEKGQTIFDSATDTTMYLVSGQTNGTSGSLQNSNLNGRKAWVVITSHGTPGNQYHGWIAPVFSHSGSTLFWYYPSNNLGEAMNNQFIYGVY